MILKTQEILRFGQQRKGGKITLSLTTAWKCVMMLRESGPFFGQLDAKSTDGCVSSTQLAFIVQNPFLTNWGSSIYADIELLPTPAGRFLKYLAEQIEAAERPLWQHLMFRRYIIWNPVYDQDPETKEITDFKLLGFIAERIN